MLASHDVAHTLSHKLLGRTQYCMLRLLSITKTYPCNKQGFFFSHVKFENFIRKKNIYMYIFFLIFAQSIDCGYTLEPTIYVLEQ